MSSETYYRVLTLYRPTGQTDSLRPYTARHRSKKHISLDGVNTEYLVRYRPAGFWSDVIKIYLTWSTQGVRDVDLIWGSGGVKRDIDKLDAADAFQKTLSVAIETARMWKQHGRRPDISTPDQIKEFWHDG